ncbi:MAG: acyltransferase [Marinilabiliaceae bacterium]|nr:acyltransferase [Marinilabiliaceae bacterium]
MFLHVLVDVIKSCFFKTMLLFLSGESKNNFLRGYGIKIGKECEIYSSEFSTEPFLIEIGDHVAIASGSVFITHDGAVNVMREIFPEIDLFGKIIIGNNTVIGSNCILLPNSTIGSNCIIGAGSVVRGNIPDDSVVIGNPAKVIMRTPLIKKLYQNHKNCINTKHLNRRKKMDKVREHFKM